MKAEIYWKAGVVASQLLHYNQNVIVSVILKTSKGILVMPISSKQWLVVTRTFDNFVLNHIHHTLHSRCSKQINSVDNCWLYSKSGHSYKINKYIYTYVYTCCILSILCLLKIICIMLRHLAIILLTAWHLLSIAEASSNASILIHPCTYTYCTFIHEALCLVTFVQLL